MALLLDQVMAASFDQDCIEGEPALHIDYLNRNRNDCSWTNLCCFYNMKKLQQHYIEKTRDYYMMDARVCCYLGLEDRELYLISSEGPVFSLHSFLWLTRAETEKLKLMSYKEVVLHSKGKQYTKKVHHLVANEYCKKVVSSEERVVIDHIDENKTNNSASNLQYITHAQNIRKHALYKKAKLDEDEANLHYIDNINFLTQIHIYKPTNYWSFKRYFSLI